MEEWMTVTFYAACLKGKTLEPVGGLDAAPTLSNRNALLILDTLGIDTGDDCTGWMDIGPALGIMRSWLHAHVNRPSAARETRVMGGGGRATVIDCGVDAGYVNRRIHEIAVMLAAGKEA